MNFEEILKENESLHKLITTNQIGLISKLPKKEQFSSEFIEWLSPKYYTCFTTLFNKYKGSEKESKIVSLINNPRYCNKETEEKINNFLLPHLDISLQISEELKKNIKNKERDLIVLINTAGMLKKEVTSYINKAIFKQCHSELISEKKEIIISNALSICNSMKNAKVSQEIEFGAFTTVLDSIKSIDLSPSQKEQLASFEKKSNSSQNKYFIISGIILCLLLLKFLGGLLG